MATKININGKLISRPGTYSYIKSGITNPPLNLSYGNICIIDTGIGAGYGGGSGISGTFNSGLNSIYQFDNIASYKGFLKGGPLFQLAEPLFKPARGRNGISKAFIIKAAATTAAEIDVTLTNGAFELQVRDEGLIGNGSLTSSELTKGYAGKLIASPQTSGKFIFQLWVGTFTGTDSLNSLPYDGITAALSKPVLLMQSPEVTALSDLITWFTNDFDFNETFKLKAGSTATGNIVAGDLTTYPTYILAAGGTETYNSTHLATVLATITNLDFTFVLATEYGDNAQSSANASILSFLEEQVKYEKYMFVAGGYDSTKYALATANSSLATAAFYDTDRVTVVHGGAKKSANVNGGFKYYSQLYKAANVLGRICGLEPQVPGAFKDIDIQGEVHPLTDVQIEQALEGGVLVTNYDNELSKIVIVQAITTLQNNDYLINEDASSFDLAVKRVVSQLNKEIVYNSKIAFFSSENGPNRATIGAEDIKAWLDGFLSKKVATSNQDNLIISFRNINVSLQGDTYFVTYEFVPNTPIHKIVFTGVMLSN